MLVKLWIWMYHMSRDMIVLSQVRRWEVRSARPWFNIESNKKEKGCSFSLFNSQTLGVHFVPRRGADWTGESNRYDLWSIYELIGHPLGIPKSNMILEGQERFQLDRKIRSSCCEGQECACLKPLLGVLPLSQCSEIRFSHRFSVLNKRDTSRAKGYEVEHRDAGRVK